MLDRFFFFAGFVFFLSLSALGAELPPLTITDAMTRALDANPDVLSGHETIKQSEANLSLAVSSIFPTISGLVEAEHNKAAVEPSGNAIFGGSPYNEYLGQLNLNQPLYSGALWGAYQAAKKDIDIKRWNSEVTDRGIVESVVEDFYNVLLQERLLQVLKDTYKLDTETLVVAERYYKIGRAQKLDVLQLQTECASLKPQIATIEDTLQNAAASLATLLRVLDSGSVRLQGALAIPDHSWIKEAIKDRMPELPEVLAARKTVDQFEDARDVQMGIYWPTLNLVGDIQRSGYAKTQLFDSNSTNWGVALQLSIPIFNGLASFHLRDSLAAQERQLEFTETKTADTVTVGQIQTEKDLQAATIALEAAREAANYGRQSLQEAQRTYRLQTINYLQYQTSVQAYLTSESIYLNAKYTYIVNLSKYFNAIGVKTAVLVAKLDQMSRQGNSENE